jgi:hypothetical protein
MSVRDPLIEGEGEFHSYVEDTEIETGYSVAHLDLFLSRVRSYMNETCCLLTNISGVQLLCGERVFMYIINKWIKLGVCTILFYRYY